MFRLIAQHQLFTTVHDKILALMELDVNQACALFLEHSEHIPSDIVVSRLQTKPQLLFKVSCSKPHHSELLFISNLLQR